MISLGRDGEVTESGKKPPAPALDFWLCADSAALCRLQDAFELDWHDGRKGAQSEGADLWNVRRQNVSVLEACSDPSL
jgi:hypothetical protein